MALIDFTTVMQYLYAYGFFDVVIPFALIFAIIYGILQQAAIFKTKDGNNEVPNKKVNLVVSLAIALLVVVPHITGGYPNGYDPIEVVKQILPGTFAILVGILLFLILVGLVGGKPFVKDSQLVGLAGIIGIILFAIVVSTALYQQAVPSWLSGLFGDPVVQTLLVILLIAGGIIWFVAKEDTGGGSGFLGGIQDIFGPHK